MKIIIAVVLCLVAFTNAQRRPCGAACRTTPWNCPPCGDPLPMPPQPNTCLAPNCSGANVNTWLWPTTDPNTFYQCRPAIGGWDVVTMKCGCQTLFSFLEQRCVHPHEWRQQCPGQPANPIPSECIQNCPDCGPPGQPDTPTEPTPTVPAPCPCVCVPCIWWPCSPCPSSTACCNRQ